MADTIRFDSKHHEKIEIDLLNNCIDITAECDRPYEDYQFVQMSLSKEEAVRLAAAILQKYGQENN